MPHQNNTPYTYSWTEPRAHGQTEVDPNSASWRQPQPQPQPQPHPHPQHPPVQRGYPQTGPRPDPPGWPQPPQQPPPKNSSHYSYPSPIAQPANEGQHGSIHAQHATSTYDRPSQPASSSSIPQANTAYSYYQHPTVANTTSHGHPQAQQYQHQSGAAVERETSRAATNARTHGQLAEAQNTSSTGTETEWSQWIWNEHYQKYYRQRRNAQGQIETYWESS